MLTTAARQKKCRQEKSPAMVRKAASVSAKCLELAVDGTGGAWFSPHVTIPDSAHSSHRDGSCGHACACSPCHCQASTLSASLLSMNSLPTHLLRWWFSAVLSPTFLPALHTPPSLPDSYQLHSNNHVLQSDDNRPCKSTQTTDDGKAPTYCNEYRLAINLSVALLVLPCCHIAEVFTHTHVCVSGNVIWYNHKGSHVQLLDR